MRLPLPALAASCLALAAVCAPRVRADERDPLRFLSVVMHDVVDERAAIDADSITTSDLVAFFEYLVSNDWHALTLDEIDRARRGDAALPERSILITADDAYASDYTRLFPLLLRLPHARACVAVEGEWIEAGTGPGGSKHITWSQAREMQESGLVEFVVARLRAAHARSAATRRAASSRPSCTGVFDPVRGYEQEDGYRERITRGPAALEGTDDARARAGAARASPGPTAATRASRPRRPPPWGSALASRSTRSRPMRAAR